MHLRSLVIFLLLGFLFSCKFQEDEKLTIEKAESQANQIVSDFLEKKSNLRNQLNQTAEVLALNPDSTNRINFALSQAAYVELLIEYNSNPSIQNLLSQELPLKLETKEQLLYIAKQGYGRRNVDIDSTYIYPQLLYQLKSDYPYTLNGRKLSLTLTDSLLKTSKLLQLRRRLWLSSQLPADSIYKYWNLTRAVLNNSISADFGRDVFIYKAGQLGLSPSEINEFCTETLKRLKPVFDTLRLNYIAKLSERYRQSTPQYIPIHWLPDGKGINWNTQQYSDAIVEAVNITPVDRQQQMMQRYLDNIGLIRNTENSFEIKKIEEEAFPFINALNTQNINSSIPKEKDVFAGLGNLGLSTIRQIANNQDTPLAMKGEVDPIFSEIIYTMFSRIPWSNQFWQDEQVMSRYNAPDVHINQLHQAYSDLVYCIYVAGVVTPMQQLYYTQSFPSNLITKNYWEQMQEQLGIVNPFEDDIVAEFPGVPEDLLLNPLEHFQKMQAIIWSYQWLAQNTDVQSNEFYIPKIEPHGIPLHNMAYQGVRFPFKTLMNGILQEKLSSQYMAKYFEQVSSMLTDSLDNSVKNYNILK